MSGDDLVGPFQERAFPRSRTATLDTLRWGRRRRHVPLFCALDVTAARQALRAHRARTGEALSFTGWVVACVARAVREHPAVHALRRGRRRLVIFEDVDVALVIERREAGSAADAPTLPMPYIVRRADRKTVAEIHAEIRAAQGAPVARGETQVGSPRAPALTAIFTTLPRALRDLLFWRRLFRDPLLVKRTMGTVAVTALGMAGPAGLSWGIPVGLHPLIIALGGIERRPAVLPGSDDVVLRELLGVTVLFDHEVTDGAPVARFAARLQELMAAAHGLPQTDGGGEERARP